MIKINDLIDSMSDDIVNATREIVKIKSVQSGPKPGMPFGEGINSALEYALNLSSSLGFRTVNVDGYMGYAEYGDEGEIVGVLGHLDVVPEGEGWLYPPYGAEVHDDKIFGRGTTDDKGPIIAALYGLKAIKDANLKLSKRVRIFFGTNEESGSKDVPYYLKKDEAPSAGFTPDGEYPIIYAEKGILTFKAVKRFEKRHEGTIEIKYIRGGSVPNVVPDHCEALLKAAGDKAAIIDRLDAYIKDKGCSITIKEDGENILLVSKGVSAHGSTPHLGKNAVMQLLMCLSGLDIGGDVKEYIDFFSKNIKDETNGRTLGIYLQDEIGELSCNVGNIKLDETGGEIYLNIRYPVTFKGSDVMDVFTQKANSAGITIEGMAEQQPLYYSKEHPLIKKLQKVYREQTGLEPYLLAIGGGTYAKEMPNTVAFGPLFPGKSNFCHQINEYIDIDDLILDAKIFSAAIYELAK